MIDDGYHVRLLQAIKLYNTHNISIDDTHNSDNVDMLCNSNA